MENGFDDKIVKLKKIIDETKRGVLFTGAGISVPSGIPDFRSEGGLYSSKQDGITGKTAEQMLTHSFFVDNPEAFYRFYKAKMLHPDAKPNAAHYYFAELEKKGKLTATVTQNIDGLHQAAGAEKVFELHGSVYRNRCMACGKKFGLDYVLKADGAPKCDFCGGRIRPDVVLYEEGLDEYVIRGAVKAINSADTLFIVGTSLVVYPAAGLIEYFDGKNLVLINKGETSRSGQADLEFNCDVVQVVDALKKQG